MNVKTFRLGELHSYFSLLFLHTCVILLFIADTEDGFDTSVRLADAVAAADVSIKLKGRVTAAASVKTVRVSSTELEGDTTSLVCSKHYSAPVVLLNENKWVR